MAFKWNMFIISRSHTQPPQYGTCNNDSDCLGDGDCIRQEGRGPMAYESTYQNSSGQSSLLNQSSSAVMADPLEPSPIQVRLHFTAQRLNDHEQ